MNPGADIRCERQIVLRLISGSQVNGRKSSCLRPNRAWWRSFGDRRANAFPAFFCPASTFPMRPMSSSLPDTSFITGAQDSHVLSLMVPQAWRTPPNPSLKTGLFMADSLLSRSPIRCPCDTDQGSPQLLSEDAIHVGLVRKPTSPGNLGERHFAIFNERLGLCNPQILSILVGR
jgi:hypothetical protein